MRFIITDKIKENKALYILIIVFVLFSLFFWLSSWIYFYNKYGFSYATAFNYFFQDIDFPEKISLSQLSDDIHIDIFLKSFFLLMVFSLLILFDFSNKLKIFLLIASSFFGFSYIFSDIFIIYLSDIFIYFKILSFFLFQILTGFSLFLILYFLIFENKNKPPIKSNLILILAIFLVYLLSFGISNFLIFFSKMGFSIEGVKAYYLGNPEIFLKPKTFEGLFKIFYPHFISMAIFSFVVAHFILFTEAKFKILIGLSLFILSFLDNISGFLIRFIHPDFAIFKLVVFVLLEISIFYSSFILFKNLSFK